MPVKWIEYSRGLFESIELIDPSRAALSGRLEHPGIPAHVVEALLKERILELEGDFGDPTLGDPVEVDLLTIQADQGLVRIRVFNRGICLFLGVDGPIVRLHRFLSILRRQLAGDG